MEAGKMKKTLVALSMFVMIAAHSLSLAQPTDEDVTLSEIQAAMTDHAYLIGRSDLATQLDGLDFDSWMVIYDSMPTKVMYLNAVESMRQNAAKSRDKQSVFTPSLNAISQAVLATTFSPAYPTGTDYNVYIATLPGLSLLFDTPDIGT